MASYWTCPGCGTRNERVKQKCTGVVREGNRVRPCGRRRPKRRVVAHARVLRDQTWEHFRDVNAKIHGPAMPGEWSPEDCGVCGKHESSARHMDRDHDHISGLPRGLACPGNQGCNALMPRQLTLERARAIVAYLERVEAFYGAQERGA